MGLPTPNIFAGEQNFHSRLEWVSVQDMEKAVEVIVALAQVWEERASHTPLLSDHEHANNDRYRAASCLSRCWRLHAAAAARQPRLAPCGLPSCRKVRRTSTGSACTQAQRRQRPSTRQGRRPGGGALEGTDSRGRSRAAGAGRRGLHQPARERPRARAPRQPRAAASRRGGGTGRRANRDLRLGARRSREGRQLRLHRQRARAGGWRRSGWARC